MRLADLRVLSAAFAFALWPMESGTPGTTIPGTVRTANELPCGDCVTWENGTHTFWGHYGAPCVGGQPDCFQCNDQECFAEYLVQGSCNNHHLFCGMSDDDTEILTAALEREDRATVEKLMLDHENTIRVNPDRGVIQVLDCGGAVKAQLRL